MRTKRVLGCMAAMTMVLHAGAQWNTAGNTITSNEWFGAAAGSTVPLRMETRVNQPIEWYTNNLRRMFLHQTLVGQTVNGYTGVDLSGNLGIGLFNATTGSGPITRPLTLLHLDNGGSEDAGFRDWMRTGVTMSQISDLMYVGLKNDTAEVNSATIVWSDNFDGIPWGVGRMQFVQATIDLSTYLPSMH